MGNDTMLFNVNNTVRVKLTATGLNIHRRTYEKMVATVKACGGTMPEYVRPPEDSEGWSTWQCWELMRQFGSHMTNGCNPPFETIIDVEIPQDVVTFERSQRERTKALSLEDWVARGIALVRASEYLSRQEGMARKQSLAVADALLAEAKRCHRIVAMMEAKDAE